MAYKTVDPSSLPDGSCWTVVQTLNGAEVSRTRFGDEESARNFANEIVFRDGLLVHLEGGSAIME